MCRAGLCPFCSNTVTTKNCPCCTISPINVSTGVIIVIATAFAIASGKASLAKMDKVQLLVLLLYGYAWLSSLWTPSLDVFYTRWPASVPYDIVFFLLAPILSQRSEVLGDGFRWAAIFGIPTLILSAFNCEWGRRGMILAKPFYVGGEMWTETFPLTVASFAATIAENSVDRANRVLKASSPECSMKSPCVIRSGSSGRPASRRASR